MADVLKEVFSYIPLNTLFESWGISAETSLKISGTIQVLLIALLIWVIPKLVKHIENWKAARDLTDFSIKEVSEFRKYYINTKCQNVSPSYEDEPGSSHSNVIKKPLVSEMLKMIKNRKKDHKFFIILAEAGMGKTTFLVNLYMKYTSLFKLRKHKMRLLPFSDQNVLERITEISRDERKHYILLLDAFDEDKAFQESCKSGAEIGEMFKQRIDDIISEAKYYQFVIITSRTQYFPAQDDIPYDLKIPKYSGGGYHTLQKIYISPFDDNDIHKYLRKKFGVLRFWNIAKKRNAYTAIQKASYLVARPMLLSYIDLINENEKELQTKYDVYEVLVDKWIGREADKCHYATDRVRFQRDLYNFSVLCAKHIYEHEKLSKGDSLALIDEYGLNLTDYDATGKSLLSRDKDYNWRFAHRSIFEFFLAQYIYQVAEETEVKDLVGLDMALQFTIEKMISKKLEVKECYTSELFEEGLHHAMENISSGNVNGIIYLTIQNLVSHRINELEKRIQYIMDDKQKKPK